MSVKTCIEIAASPEEVRRVFLDFEHWPEVKNDLIRSISRLPSNNGGPVEPREKLIVNFAGTESQVMVLENTPEAFRWRGDVFYVLSGEHSFRFEPSENIPGGTRFINSEVFMRANKVFMRLFPPTAMFKGTCKDFKARVENLQKDQGTKTKG